MDKYRTGKKRLFLKKARLINWRIKGLKVYLKVSYGKSFDNFGKFTDFWNDGDYTSRGSFWLAFNVFTEDD
ncbi:MAG: hypothetical protein UT17_C0003G0242 [Candidatus Woesebacteria bacterium GW2011_GWB1_39_10]|uniref:Uncharacterized protein n=2 Tax=Candidatus Woeseibacteriota TaxID=1752722 RepID=A0A0G0P298_9BACT|nr:MAG: hypothetical protein UT17_C0003G0242 [Candidatus Woesebacteria bacterium GW2011_GWB1_39_10]KKS91179.1 MAG: hypothetical protein UV66_C0001G0536 [Candidatus Woesebacteria bacterium GW2011_GWA1_43_12]